MMNEPSIERDLMFSGKASKPGTSNLANIKLSLKGRKDGWCSHYKKYGHTKETCFKLHRKEKTLNHLAELEEQLSRKANQATSNSENPGKTPSSSSIEQGMPALYTEIEHLKSLMEFISNPPSGTCFLTMTDKNFNSFFNVSKIWTLGF